MNFRDIFWKMVYVCIMEYSEKDTSVEEAQSITKKFRESLFPNGEGEEISPFYKLEPYDVAMLAVGENPYFIKDSTYKDKLDYDNKCREEWPTSYGRRWSEYMYEYFELGYSDLVVEAKVCEAYLEFDDLMFTDYNKISMDLLRKLNGPGKL